MLIRPFRTELRYRDVLMIVRDAILEECVTPQERAEVRDLCIHVGEPSIVEDADRPGDFLYGWTGTINDRDTDRKVGEFYVPDWYPAGVEVTWERN